MNIKIGDYVKYIGTGDGGISVADYDKIRYGQVRKVLAIDYLGNVGDAIIWLEGLSQENWLFFDSQFEIVCSLKYGDKVWARNTGEWGEETTFIAYVPEHKFPYITETTPTVCHAYEHARLVKEPNEIEKLKAKYKELGEEIEKLEKG